MAFSSLGLADTLVQAVNDRGYTQPTPIQLQAIPAVLTGKDLLAGAQTGTGKTAAFTLPILQLLSTRPAPATRQANSIRALVLTPTRELAAQVQDNVRHYGAHLPLKSMVMFGGVSINPQIEQLVNIDILVATPGRLLDHVSQGTLDLSQLEILVLDEADRMLDMGFIHDIRRILKLLPAKRQNLLFSATFSDEIKALAEGLLDEPVLIEVARRNAAADTVAQSVYLVDRERKRELLMKLIQDNNWYQVLVFTRTKHGANRLAEQLDKAGISAMAIHGNKSQGARTKALGDFRLGKLQVLVATDIAARGIDISELPHVINFELPHVPEDYVHRIGRTGRAGVEGEALSLVCVDEHKLLVGIERLLKRELEKKLLRALSQTPLFAPSPSPMVASKTCAHTARSSKVSVRRVNAHKASAHREKDRRVIARAATTMVNSNKIAVRNSSATARRKAKTASSALTASSKHSRNSNSAAAPATNSRLPTKTAIRLKA
jgi:ATP-dependent RNA helicase RhlE